MIIIIFLLLLLLVGAPMLIFKLIKSTIRVKSEGNALMQWFYIWLIGVITIITLMLLLYILAPLGALL
jgi:hypothetical protein